MIVAGIGCRRGVPAHEVEAALSLALDAHGLGLRDISRIATEQSKATEQAIRALAATLAVPIVAFSPETLAAAADRVLTRSARVAAAKGTPSIAEAAALVAAGANARLLGPRHASAAATAALAIGDGP